MPNGETIPNLDFLAFFAAHTEEGANHALLVGIAAQGVVEDREDGLNDDLDQLRWLKDGRAMQVLEVVLSRSKGL